MGSSFWDDEDEYTYEEVYENRKLAANCVMFVTSICVIVANVSALLVVKRKTKISNAVRLYFYAENILRMIPAIIHSSFCTPCDFTYFCDEDYEYTVGFVSNMALGNVRLSSGESVEFLTLAIAVNRFFAVVNGGRYYQRVTSIVKWQTILIIIAPLPFTLPIQYYGSAYYYDTVTYYWWRLGTRSSSYLKITNVVSICAWCVIIVVDCSTAWIIYRRRDKTGSNAMKRIDIQILKQVFTFHAVLLAYLSIKKYRGLYEYHNFQKYSYFELFWFYTFLPAVIDLIAGASRVYFLQNPKKENAHVKVSPHNNKQDTLTSISGSTKTA